MREEKKVHSAIAMQNIWHICMPKVHPPLNEHRRASGGTFTVITMCSIYQGNDIANVVQSAGNPPEWIVDCIWPRLYKYEI